MRKSKETLKLKISNIEPQLICGINICSCK